jgi:tripartite-type tricarboxylate transporter receptor subunit TctC
LANHSSSRAGRGAGGNIGTEAVVNAPPDGYALLLANSSNVSTATLYGKLYFIRDLTPVASIDREPLIMVVNPSLPAKTVAEFIAYAKANPGKINMASGGVGASSHLAGELFKAMTDIDMVHVPYRGGGPAQNDLLGGQVQVQFSATTGSTEYIEAGKLRALAVTTAWRYDALPHIPTVGEFVPGYEVSIWYGIVAPKNTSAEVIDKLNKEINAFSADPKMKARLADLGGAPFVSSPAEFGKLIAEETEKWGKVIRAANIKPE